MNQPTPIDRAEQLIAQLRDLQLQAALRGRIETSYRYAERAQRVRQAAASGRDALAMTR